MVAKLGVAPPNCSDKKTKAASVGARQPTYSYQDGTRPDAFRNGLRTARGTRPPDNGASTAAMASARVSASPDRRAGGPRGRRRRFRVDPLRPPPPRALAARSLASRRRWPKTGRGKKCRLETSRVSSSRPGPLAATSRPPRGYSQAREQEAQRSHQG